MPKLVLLFVLLTSLGAWAQDPSQSPQQPPAAPPVAEEPVIPEDGIRVSIIGYHDLAENLPETAMRIHTSKFRKQMEAIRQLGLKVITLDEFTAWKRDGRTIPEKSVLITFDDGWKSVYTEAYPILKEFGFPFTIFLYEQYVDIGGKSLTTAMIQEMMAHGCSVGSHSVSHPFPLTVKTFRKKGTAPYDTFLRKEMGRSKSFLESKFKTPVNTYAFPGGFYTEEMLKLGDEFGYHFMFTVLPGKIKRPLPDETLPRYIILGNYDKIFEIATTFREGQTSGSPGAMAPGLVQATPYPVVPEAGSIINSRLPEISADLTNVPNLDPKSVLMKIGGFGEVPAAFDEATRKLTWKLNRRLHQPNCTVLVTWKDTAGKAPESPLRWTFQIDLDAAYLPDGE